mmetsp:Transcript_71163/g.112706  ORF Transcript_71163/g.112706 Transcript_71163/m.112706 type:complete len:153 (-) Transcript_71163:98-556(-)
MGCAGSSGGEITLGEHGGFTMPQGAGLQKLKSSGSKTTARVKQIVTAKGANELYEALMKELVKTIEAQDFKDVEDDKFDSQCLLKVIEGHAEVFREKGLSLHLCRSKDANFTEPSHCAHWIVVVNNEVLSSYQPDAKVFADESRALEQSMGA